MKRWCLVRKEREREREREREEDYCKKREAKEIN